MHSGAYAEITILSVNITRFFYVVVVLMAV